MQYFSAMVAKMPNGVPKTTQQEGARQHAETETLTFQNWVVFDPDGPA